MNTFKITKNNKTYEIEISWSCDLVKIFEIAKVANTNWESKREVYALYGGYAENFTFKQAVEVIENNFKIII